MNKKMTKTKGSKLSLSIMIAFNQSDSTYGWFNFLTGMTGLLCQHRILLLMLVTFLMLMTAIIRSLTSHKSRQQKSLPKYWIQLSAYISDPLEYTLDTRGSLSLPPSVVPILSIEQVHTTKLGAPYSDCRKEEDHSLSNGFNDLL